MRYLFAPLLLVSLILPAACAVAPQPMSGAEIAKARAVDEYALPVIKPPQARQLTMVVNKSVNQVCRAIEAFAASPQAASFVLTHNIYKVNNRQPASATIMLNAADPETCLDCGVNRFAYYQGEELLKQWEYNVAARETVLTFAENDTLSRFMSLLGQANVRVTPNKGGGSEITVNIDYVLERKITAYTSRQLGQERIIMPVSGISVLKFNSLEAGVMEDSLTCISRGIMEQRILEGIKANLP